jgi:hypothetical protein
MDWERHLQPQSLILLNDCARGDEDRIVMTPPCGPDTHVRLLVRKLRRSKAIRNGGVTHP